MSIAITTSRSLSGLTRGTRPYLPTPFGVLLGIQNRAAFSTIPSSLQPCTFAPFRNIRRRPHEKRQLRIPSSRRAFSATIGASHGDWSPPKAGEELFVTFVDKEGDEHKIAVAKGDNLLDVAQANDIEMEGACGGSCACSTCHVIVESDDLYSKMPEPEDDENDMLDLAFGLTETSRLGCQVIMDESLDGLRVKLPSMTRNMQASDFSKKD